MKTIIPEFNPEAIRDFCGTLVSMAEHVDDDCFAIESLPESINRYLGISSIKDIDSDVMAQKYNLYSRVYEAITGSCYAELFKKFLDGSLKATDLNRENMHAIASLLYDPLPCEYQSVLKRCKQIGWSFDEPLVEQMGYMMNPKSVPYAWLVYLINTGDADYMDPNTGDVYHSAGHNLLDMPFISVSFADGSSGMLKLRKTSAGTWDIKW